MALFYCVETIIFKFLMNVLKKLDAGSENINVNYKIVGCLCVSL